LPVFLTQDLASEQSLLLIVFDFGDFSTFELLPAGFKFRILHILLLFEL